MKRLIVYILIFSSLYYFYFEVLRADRKNESKFSILYKDIKRITSPLYKLFEKTSIGKKFSDYRKTERLVSDVLNNYERFDESQLKAKRDELLKKKESLKSASLIRRTLQNKFLGISISLLNNELEKRDRERMKENSPYKDVMEKGELEKKSFLKERKYIKKLLE